MASENEYHTVRCLHSRWLYPIGLDWVYPGESPKLCPEFMTEETNKETDKKDQPVKRKRGRPRKENRLMTRYEWEQEQKKAKGRPKGMRTAVKKLEERLLSANRIELVIDSIVKAATDDEHKNQAAAWKLIMDRMAPLSHYEKKGGGEKPMIQINVSSVDSITDTVQGEVIDHESD